MMASTAGRSFPFCKYVTLRYGVRAQARYSRRNELAEARLSGNKRGCSGGRSGKEKPDSAVAAVVVFVSTRRIIAA